MDGSVTLAQAPRGLLSRGEYPSQIHLGSIQKSGECRGPTLGAALAG